MATSYVHSIARFPLSRVKIRPKRAIQAKSAVRRPDDALTVDRTTGVEEPDTEGREQSARHSPALIREAVETALDSLDILERQAKDVARRFRRQTLADANVGLTYLVQSTQTLLRLADLAASASGTRLDALCAQHHITAPADTDVAVSNLIREQLAEDWPAVAIVLEQRFLSALAGWRSVFEALGGNAPNPFGTAA